ncbi:MAG TPA: 3-phosphoshikimate 1-carboxyvinyltransferase, partial [Bacteroidota bacterium]|nr:3-phosphoshikimate 1-carboxyvinyltransferase [Bacteroidota bacterium]
GATQFELVGHGLSGGTVSVRGSSSSQFLSAILLVSPYANASLSVRVEGALASAPYVELTLDVMNRFGVTVFRNADGSFSVPMSSRFHATEYAVEADASGALYPFAAAAIAGGSVFVPGIRAASLQADAGFPAILQNMGCLVHHQGDGTVVERTGPLKGLNVRMNGMPDAVPALAAVALFADRPTRIEDVGQLRFKESNRLEGLASELEKLGANIRVEGDGLTITPCPLHGGLLGTHGDHRLAMSYAAVGLRVPGVIIDDPDCVRKSFPRFWQEFDHLVENTTIQTRESGAYGGKLDR